MLNDRGAYHTASFEPNRERAHHVAILIGQGHCACVANELGSEQPQLLVYGPGTEVLSHKDLPLNPRSVSFVSLPEWSTLVPDGALDPADGGKHLALVHGKLPEALVRDEPVGTLGATCLYAHDETHERTILERFPNARALPLQAVMVRGAQMRSSTGPVLLVHRGVDRVDVALAKEQGLLLSNSYTARTAEDLLYFCLLAAEQAGLQPGEVPIRTGGSHLLPLERELLDRYFKDQASAVPSPWPDAPESLGPVDRWLAAFDQFACVS